MPITTPYIGNGKKTKDLSDLVSQQNIKKNTLKELTPFEKQLINKIKDNLLEYNYLTVEKSCYSEAEGYNYSKYTIKVEAKDKLDQMETSKLTEKNVEERIIKGRNWRATFGKIDSLITQVLATTGGGLLLGASIYEVPGALIGGILGAAMGYLSFLKEKSKNHKVNA
jgi:hypothetical protein